MFIHRAALVLALAAAAPLHAQPPASLDARMRAFVHEPGEWGALRDEYTPYQNMTGSGCDP
jgi:hypothetical protein